MDDGSLHADIRFLQQSILFAAPTPPSLDIRWEVRGNNTAYTIRYKIIYFYFQAISAYRNVHSSICYKRFF